jgi:peroxiredoxin
LSPDPDRYDRERTGSSEDVRKAARPYSAVVGLVFLVAVLIAGINSLSNSGRAVEGLDDWSPLPRFAAPAATGTLDGDANINRDDRSSSGERRTPACQVRGPRRDVIRICDFFHRPLVIVAWFTRGCGTCRSQLNSVEAVRKRFPAVQFLGLDIRDSLAHARKEVIEHGWGFPMALDRDGAVSGLYGVGVGPTSFFAYPGGIAMETVFGELDRQELELRLRRLLRSSRRLGLLP